MLARIPRAHSVHQCAVSRHGKRSWTSSARTRHQAGSPRCTASATDKSVPSASDLDVWRNAQAVCFDVDCTILENDSLDLLAEFMGKGAEVASLTSQAMDGSMNLEQALEKRLQILDCSPDDLRKFTEAHPPSTRLTPGAQDLVAALLARNIEVYLISGGFRELILPLARLLGVPKRNVMANRMNWQFDDETGLPSKLVGFDVSQPVAHNRGKPAAIKELRRQHPYQNVVMIGDGITDLEAVLETDAADLFIGYGGAVVREAVFDAAAWFVMSHWDLIRCLKRYTVSMIGSGAWACAAARMVAQNTLAADPADEFADTVKMWVFEEDFEGRKLTDVINNEHRNAKYCPDIVLPDNVVAVADLQEAVGDADILIFCVPHQFMRGILSQMQGMVQESTIAISLTKGMRVRRDGPQLLSSLINNKLRVDCSVLMGANIASGIAREELSEATIGYNNLENATLLRKLFETPYFTITMVPDVAGAEMAGTLKNIVAVATGFVDGLGYGDNTKAAIMRQGLSEMRLLSQQLYPTVRESTFSESCGIGDLIATCYGGRNRYVASTWARMKCQGEQASFGELEEKMLGGQKLQGVLTSDEVQEVLEVNGWEKQYPLFTAVNRIIHGIADVKLITSYRTVAEMPVSEDGDLLDAILDPVM